MKDRYKRLLFTTPLCLILLLIFAKSPVKVAATNNPIFATIDEVQQMITTALSPLQSSLQGVIDRVSNLEATVTPIPGQVINLQNHQSQDETQLTNLSQQVQALSATISAAPNPTSWDITGTYTLQFSLITQSPLSQTVTITVIDPTTGNFTGSGSMNGSLFPISGIVDGAQFILHTQLSGSSVDVDGSIAPDGKLWGVSAGVSGHSFVMTTLSGAATKEK